MINIYKKHNIQISQPKKKTHPMYHNPQKQNPKTMHNRHLNHDDESLDLGRYIGSNDEDHIFEPSNQYKNMHSEELHMQINRINSRLQSICMERLGDLTNTSPKEIEKTVQLVETLMNEIKKLQEAKAKSVNQRRQAQQNLMQNQQVIEKLSRDKKSVENQKQSLIQKVKGLEKTLKQTNQKNQQEKQELNKQLRQFQTREKTIDAQFRKKQQTIKALQDGMRKYQEKNNFKNSIQIIQKFEYGPNIYGMYATNGENEYGRLAKNNRDEVNNKLVEENQHLRECLTNIYKELNTVLELKRETLRNKKGYDGEYDSFFELNYFRPETFSLPENWSHGKLKELTENVQKFKEAIKIGDHAESRVDDRKEGCVNGVKQLISNYKQVVEAQDQLLNKVLLKSKQFKANEMSHLENRFSKVLDNNDLDRAKRFVEEQAQYLETKNSELEKTKKMMQAAMKRAEENKKEMIKKRQAFEEEALEMRRAVEVLPAIIEEELSKALN